MAEPPFDLPRTHRWFAVEANNLGWDLAAAATRSAADDERMIHAAHAACFHWLAVGTLLNHLRAQTLLATAYTRANLADSAVRHAQRCLDLSHELGVTQSAFDRAAAHGCASAAFKIAGRRDESLAEYALALRAAQTFEDGDDRTVFDQLFPEP